MIDRRRAALELAAYAAQLVDEFRALTDGLIGVCNLLKRRLKLVGQVASAVRAETPVFIRLFFDIIVERGIFIHCLELLKL
ncbi:hypothetical protein SDC9_151749 [bioreactor metagenome]|uniref:Uncharacterized protein n=1 Tax=bioreactor metagenome TaxID=1076179 RepID=A0A645ER50_9ZZZZ